MRSRRLSTRREVVAPCQAVRESDFRLLADRTLDVSVDGLLLPIDLVHGVVPTLGDALIVSFPIPGAWIDAEATVVRIVHGRRPNDEGAAIGISFDVIGVGARAALAGWLHGRPPPLPRRGPLSRMRRGAPPPRLVDHEWMDGLIPLAAELDVEEVPESTPPPEHDALRILREVGKAWRALAADA